MQTARRVTVPFGTVEHMLKSTPLSSTTTLRQFYPLIRRVSPELTRQLYDTAF